MHFFCCIKDGRHTFINKITPTLFAAYELHARNFNFVLYDIRLVACSEMLSTPQVNSSAQNVTRMTESLAAPVAAIQKAGSSLTGTEVQYANSTWNIHGTAGVAAVAAVLIAVAMVCLYKHVRKQAKSKLSISADDELDASKLDDSDLGARPVSLSEDVTGSAQQDEAPLSPLLEEPKTKTMSVTLTMIQPASLQQRNAMASALNTSRPAQPQNEDLEQDELSNKLQRHRKRALGNLDSSLVFDTSNDCPGSAQYLGKNHGLHLGPGSMCYSNTSQTAKSIVAETLGRSSFVPQLMARDEPSGKKGRLDTPVIVSQAHPTKLFRKLPAHRPANKIDAALICHDHPGSMPDASGKDVFSKDWAGRMMVLGPGSMHSNKADGCHLTAQESSSPEKTIDASLVFGSQDGPESALDTCGKDVFSTNWTGMVLGPGSMQYSNKSDGLHLKARQGRLRPGQNAAIDASLVFEHLRGTGTVYAFEPRISPPSLPDASPVNFNSLLVMWSSREKKEGGMHHVEEAEEK
jgi:hypothetical protein